MMTYLENGWYEANGTGKLNASVVDGAMDVAGGLLRAGVTTDLLDSLALQLRAFFTAMDPRMDGSGEMDERIRETILIRLDPEVEDTFELSSFIRDCLDHVQDRKDLLALYLHVIHVRQMVQLLKEEQQAAS